MNIIIIILLSYFVYTGFKQGMIRQLSHMISYIFGFLLSKMIFLVFSNYLEFVIVEINLRNKIAYLIAFIIIVYIFKILTHAIENLIYISWNNKILGLIFGLINGIMICSLIISITQDVMPYSFNFHEYWATQSTLYQYLDLLQKEYLIQYVEIKNK